MTIYFSVSALIDCRCYSLDCKVADVQEHTSKTSGAVVFDLPHLKPLSLSGFTASSFYFSKSLNYFAWIHVC